MFVLSIDMGKSFYNLFKRWEFDLLTFIVDF